MNTRELLNILKTAQKFINSKATGGHSDICRSVYFMNTGGKLEVRATNGHNAFSSALDCVEPDA